MTDTLSAERRSWNMSQIRSRDTKPEITLRSALHRRGLRFRLHDRRLPGCPDIVLSKYKTAIMVHGCFWHRHYECNNATMPSTRTEFWNAKFESTVARDRQNEDKLIAKGWRVITVWECDIKKNLSKVVDDICCVLKESM